MKIPCSVPLLTLNCRPALERLLPVLVAEIEDVYIMDGNSTDGTQEYAHSLGVRVEKQFETDEPNQRITDFCAMRLRLWSKAACSWLFLLDADEMPTPALLEKIRQIVAANDPMVVHRFCRLAQLPDGRIVQRAFFYPDLYIRLFNTASGATLANRKVHERFVIPSNVAQVDHPEALLAPWPTPQRMWQKQMRYHALETQSIQSTWTYMLRWIVFYNLRSAIGQTLRAVREWVYALVRHEVSLPWAYASRMIAYRYVSLWFGVVVWASKRLSKPSSHS